MFVKHRPPMTRLIDMSGMEHVLEEVNQELGHLRTLVDSGV